jgi:hypothetical protein
LSCRQPSADVLNLSLRADVEEREFQRQLERAALAFGEEANQVHAMREADGAVCLKLGCCQSVERGSSADTGHDSIEMALSALSKHFLPALLSVVSALQLNGLMATHRFDYLASSQHCGELWMLMSGKHSACDMHRSTYNLLQSGISARIKITLQHCGELMLLPKNTTCVRRQTRHSPCAHSVLGIEDPVY